MKKLLIYFTILTFLLSSCASSTGVINFNSDERVTAKIKRLNLIAKKKTCEIFLRNGDSFSGKNVFVRQDSTFWEDSEKTKLSALTTEIQQIKINSGKNIGTTAVQGMLLGFGLGFGLGYADASTQSETKDLAKVAGTGIGIIGAIIGVVFGVLVGVGNKDKFITYTFVNGELK